LFYQLALGGKVECYTVQDLECRTLSLSSAYATSFPFETCGYLEPPVNSICQPLCPQTTEPVFRRQMLASAPCKVSQELLLLYRRCPPRDVRCLHLLHPLLALSAFLHLPYLHQSSRLHRLHHLCHLRSDKWLRNVLFVFNECSRLQGAICSFFETRFTAICLIAALFAFAFVIWMSTRCILIGLMIVGSSAVWRILCVLLQIRGALN
jgi:hypothetical protein